MIVRNEEEDLPKCLESVRGVADEIVVVDTGSTDRTGEVAELFGAKVVPFAWTGSFADARNVSIAHASGDWILWMDADEELCREDIPVLREAVLRDDCEAYLVHVVNYVGGTPDEGSTVVGLSPRLFRRRPAYAFTGRIHEQILVSIQSALPEARIETIPVRIYHYGYLEDRVLKRGKTGRNLALLKEEVEKYPDDPFTRFNLAMEYIRRGEYEDAEREFRQAYLLRPDPSSAYAPHLLKNLCICLRALGRHEDALRVVSDTLAVLPDFTDMEFLRGLIYLDVGDYASAMHSFTRCVEMGDAPPCYVSQRGLGSHHAWAMLGNIFTVMEERKKAVEAYTKALQANPRYTPALRGLADLLLSREDPEKVMGFLRRVADLSDEAMQVVFADALCSAKRPQEAIDLLDELTPSEAALTVRGKALMFLGRYAEAEVAFRQLAGPGKDIVPAMTHAALCAFLRKDTAGVEQCAVKLEAIGKTGVAWTCRALVAVLDGKPILDMPKDRKSAIDTVIGLLSTLLGLNEFDAFELALPIFSWLIPRPQVHLELGKLYMSHGFQETALEELSQAHEAGVIDAEGYRILGRLAEGKELWEDAVIFYRKALEMDGQHLPTYTALVQALARLRRYGEALDVLEEAKRIFPHARILEEARKALVVAVGDA